MATLKLPRKNAAPSSSTDRPRKPARPAGVVRRRPTLAQAQEERAERARQDQERPRGRRTGAADGPDERPRGARTEGGDSRAGARSGARNDSRGGTRGEGRGGERGAGQRTDRRTDRPTERPTERRTHRRTDQRADSRGERRTDQRTDARVQRRDDHRTDRRTDQRTGRSDRPAAKPARPRPRPDEARGDARPQDRAPRPKPRPAEGRTSGSRPAETQARTARSRPPQEAETRPARRKERQTEHAHSERSRTERSRTDRPRADRPRDEAPAAESRPRRKPAPAPTAGSAERPRAAPRPDRRDAPAPVRRREPPADVAHDGEPEGERLSKRMTAMGLASRREADEWIEAGWVRVDGRIAVLGQRVRPDARIDIDPAARGQQAQRVTVLLNKPVGYVSGQAEDGYQDAASLVRPENHWSGDRSGIRFQRGHLRSLAPAGRLDIDSVGLLVLTQDGRIAKLLIGDDGRVEKEYLVRVRPMQPGGFGEEHMALLQHGLELDGKPLKPAKVSWQNEDQLRFVLREGRKRQIRRMCEAVGLQVLGLKRVRIGSVTLGQLPPGQWRYLAPHEQFA